MFQTGSGSNDVDVPTVFPPTKTGELSPLSLTDLMEMMQFELGKRPQAPNENIVPSIRSLSSVQFEATYETQNEMFGRTNYRKRNNWIVKQKLLLCQMRKDLVVLKQQTIDYELGLPFLAEKLKIIVSNVKNIYRLKRT